MRGRRFACELTDVREIVPVGRVARLPGAPAHVLGVLNVRGLIVTTVDLGVRFGTGPVDRGDGAILLFEAGGKVMGGAVDAVHDVLPVAEGGVGAAEGTTPETAPEAGTGLVRGLVAVGESVVSVIDVGALVRDVLGTTGGET